MKTNEELMGGISFLKLGQVEIKKDEPLPTGSLASRLCYAIKKDDKQMVEILAGKAGNKMSAPLEKQLIETLTSMENWSDEIAEILDEHGIFPTEGIIKKLIDLSGGDGNQQSWAAACWIHRNEDAIDKLRKNKIRSSIFRAPMTDANIVLYQKLNWKHILKEVLTDHFDDYDYTANGPAAIVAKFTENNDPIEAGKLAVLLTSLDVVKGMAFTAETINEDGTEDFKRMIDKVNIQRAKVMRNIIENPGRRHIQWVEKVLQKTPELHEAWDQLWKNNSTLGEHIHLDDTSRPIKELPPLIPSQSLTELTIRRAPEWIDVFIFENNNEGERLRNIMKERDNLAMYLKNINKERMMKIIPNLVHYFGGWKDERGNNLALIFDIARGYSNGQLDQLKKFLEHDKTGMVVEPNNSGETLLDKLVIRDQWMTQRVFLAKIKRAALDCHLADRVTPPSAKPKI